MDTTSDYLVIATDYQVSEAVILLLELKFSEKLIHLENCNLLINDTSVVIEYEFTKY
jgi:hypothetical protein